MRSLVCVVVGTSKPETIAKACVAQSDGLPQGLWTPLCVGNRTLFLEFGGGSVFGTDPFSIFDLTSMHTPILVLKWRIVIIPSSALGGILTGFSCDLIFFFQTMTTRPQDNKRDLARLRLQVALSGPIGGMYDREPGPAGFRSSKRS